jgi:hypothetical protein
MGAAGERCERENPAQVRLQSALRRIYRVATATRRARLVTAAVVLAVVGGVVGGVVSQTGGGGAKPKPAANKVAPKRGNSPLLLSESGLETLANALGRPIYWVGPQPRVVYELTTSADGRIFLRYLPEGSKAGAPVAFLSVGTYPFADAFEATVRAERQKGFAPVKVGPGVAAAYARGRPTNVYEAFRGADYQIEVFDPKPGRAQRLVAERRVVPVP